MLHWSIENSGKPASFKTCTFKISKTFNTCDTFAILLQNWHPRILVSYVIDRVALIDTILLEKFQRMGKEKKKKRKKRKNTSDCSRLSCRLSRCFRKYFASRRWPAATQTHSSNDFFPLRLGICQQATKELRFSASGIFLSRDTLYGYVIVRGRNACLW